MTDVSPLVGEPLALDLINTRSLAADFLSDLDGLRAWLVLQNDRLPDVCVVADEITDPDLSAVRAVRDHTANAVGRARRGRRPAIADLEALNEALQVAPATARLAVRDEVLTATHHRTGAIGAQLATRLAEAAAELLLDPAVTEVRECEAEDCVMVFLPAHPRRRWCSATRCGNRIRVARHYQRHKGT